MRVLPEPNEMTTRAPRPSLSFPTLASSAQPVQHDASLASRRAPPVPNENRRPLRTTPKQAQQSSARILIAAWMAVSTWTG